MKSMVVYFFFAVDNLVALWYLRSFTQFPFFSLLVFSWCLGLVVSAMVGIELDLVKPKKSTGRDWMECATDNDNVNVVIIWFWPRKVSRRYRNNGKYQRWKCIRHFWVRRLKCSWSHAHWHCRRFCEKVGAYLCAKNGLLRIKMLTFAYFCMFGFRSFNKILFTKHF